MRNYKIVVGDSDDKNRDILVKMLKQNGYKVYEVSDGPSVLRIARTVRPELVIVDTNIRAMNAYEIAKIIEYDNISTVLFMTDVTDENFYNRIKSFKVFAYLNKPFNAFQVNQVIQFVIVNSSKMNNLHEKVEKLENSLSSRKLIDKAKGIIMNRGNLTENEAYNYLKKLSMDKCISMDKISSFIIKKYKE